jgi:hypothetical protein
VGQAVASFANEVRDLKDENHKLSKAKEFSYNLASEVKSVYSYCETENSSCGTYIFNAYANMTPYYGVWRVRQIKKEIEAKYNKAKANDLDLHNDMRNLFFKKLF